MLLPDRCPTKDQILLHSAPPSASAAIQNLRLPCWTALKSLHHRCCLEILFDPLVWLRKAKRIEIRSDHPIQARIFRAQGLGITENLIYDRDRDKDKGLLVDLLRFLLLLTAVCLAKSVPQRNH
jgi:hypothetical protein